MFFLLTEVQKSLKKTNEFFQSYDHKCTATFSMNHSVQGPVNCSEAYVFAATVTANRNRLKHEKRPTADVRKM